MRVLGFSSMLYSICQSAFTNVTFSLMGLREVAPVYRCCVDAGILTACQQDGNGGLSVGNIEKLRLNGHILDSESHAQLRRDRYHARYAPRRTVHGGRYGRMICLTDSTKDVIPAYSTITEMIMALRYSMRP